MTAIKVGYQGIKGAFSYQASTAFFPDATYQSYKSFHDTLRATERGDIDYAMIPVENSTAGRVMEVYNLLPDAGLHIIGEHLLSIQHCLLIPRKSLRGAPPRGMEDVEEILAWKESPLSAEEIEKAFSSIKLVQSHPQALAQCTKYLGRKVPGAETKDFYDTAASARDIASRTNGEIASIASRAAGEIYNMIILEENIEDIANNTTRFLAFGREPLDVESLEGPVISSILFETGHQPGSLLRALTVFEKHGINLTKLETYMSGPERPNPTFYVDVGANLGRADARPVLEEFAEHTENVRIMGCYPASDKRGEGSSFLAVT